MATGWPMKTTYANGDVYSASDVNDITGTVNLASGAQWAAGKNKIINGAFDNWQRGTSISLTNATTAYVADRFTATSYFSAGSSTFSRQAFTAGTAPASPYESSYFGRLTLGSTATYFEIAQKIEDVRTGAGQSVTFSFWAKASVSTPFAVIFRQNFGTGGSSNVDIFGTASTLTTSWQRFTFTTTLGSMSGKTIGAGSNLQLFIYASGSVTNSQTIDTWGWQLEQASTATAFQTASGTIQGELALCQRYLPAVSGLNNSFQGMATSTTAVYAPIFFAVTPRVAPTGITISSAGHFTAINGSATSGTGLGAVAFDSAGTTSATISGTTTGAGNPTLAANQPAFIRSNSTSSLILFTGCEL